MPPSNPPPEIFNFSFDPSLAPFNVSPRQWLVNNDKHWDFIVVGNVVFDDQGRVLLVQRAAHDTMPNRWEVTGGAADQEDDDSGNEKEENADSSVVAQGSLLGAAARELWEESGLIATRFTHLVPQPYHAPTTPTDTAPYFASVVQQASVFASRTGKQIYARFAFHVEVKSRTPVVLDPEEHQDFAWATEDEVRGERLGSGRAIPITAPAVKAMLLEAFRLRAEAAKE